MTSAFLQMCVLIATSYNGNFHQQVPTDPYQCGGWDQSVLSAVRDDAVRRAGVDFAGPRPVWLDSNIEWPPILVQKEWGN